MSSKIEKIDIEKILLWNLNPRNMEEINDEKEIIKSLFTNNDHAKKDQKGLAKDILKDGLIPSDLPVFVYNEDVDKYYVYEGNRRIANIKCLINPILLDFDRNLVKYYENISDRYQSRMNDLKSINGIITTHEEALSIVDKLHNVKSKNPGVVRETWGAEQKEFFDDTFDKESKKTPAWYIINKYSDNFDRELKEQIKYSSINRLLKYSLFKNISGIDDYENLDENQIELIQYYLDQALLVEKNHDIKISRFRLQDVRKYLEDKLRNKYVEITTRDDKYIIECKALFEINKGDDLNIIPTIKDKETGEIINDSKFKIKYIDSNGKTVDSIDTNLVETYTYEISYNNVVKKGDIIVSLPKTPIIKLKEYTKTIPYETSYNLRNNISEKCENLNIDNIYIRPSKTGNKAKIQNEVFLSDNTIGEYKIIYGYKPKDDDPSVQQPFKIIVKQEEYNLFTVSNKSIFSSNKVRLISLNHPVIKLIEQTSIINYDDYHYVVAASLRTILELLFKHYSQEQGVQLVSGIRNLFKTVINDIKVKFKNSKKQMTHVCDVHNLSYKEEKNFIESFTDDDIDKLCKKLNLTTHTGGGVITKDIVLELGRNIVTRFIIICNAIINDF